MSVENSVRIFLVLVGAGAVFTGPWWLPIVAMVLLSMRYRAWEVLALGLLADFLIEPVYRLPFYLIAALIIFWAFEPLRRELLVS